MNNHWSYICDNCFTEGSFSGELQTLKCPHCHNKIQLTLKNYLCLDCNTCFSDNAEIAPSKCPNCLKVDKLYRFLKEETNLFHGKEIETILVNEWANYSKLIIFKDGTKAIVEVPYSEHIDFKLKE